MIYSLTIKNMVGDNKLDFKKYKNRFRQLYPSLDDKKLEKIFYWRVEFWDMIVENYDEIKF